MCFVLNREDLPPFKISLLPYPSTTKPEILLRYCKSLDTTTTAHILYQAYRLPRKIISPLMLEVQFLQLNGLTE